MFDKLLGIEARFENVNEQLCDPQTVSDQQLYTKLMKELKQLTPVVEKFREYKKHKDTFEESKMLLDEGYLDPSYTAAQAIGYKEIIGAILGKTSLTEATEALKQASRNYAKRQLTWFRNMKGASVLFADSEDGVMKSTDELTFECISLFDEQK